jgi:hypothetical protein
MPPSSRTPSPSKRGTNTDLRHKLGDYNIHIKRGMPLPPELQELVEQLMLPREAALQSPNAKEVARKQAAAAEMSEADAIAFMHRQLLLQPAKDDGVPLTEMCRNPNLSRSFLPPAATPLAAPLEQAQPDTAYGYVRETIANRLQIPSPFTMQEDHDLARFEICPGLHTPFFTCQWKGGRNANHHDAATQGARDGAVMVNYMRWVHRAAAPTATEPSVRDTCHFSATCDITSLHLFVHWASASDDGSTMHYYMEQLDDFQLSKVASITAFRAFFRNLLDHAVGERLRKIQRAIPLVTAAMRNQRARIPETPSASASSVPAASVASVSSLAGAVFACPPTPKSAASTSSKKRARTFSDGLEES